MASNPLAFVVVVGCYAQLKPREIADIDGVDLVLGAEEKFNLVAHLESLEKRDTGLALAGEIKEVRAFVPGHSSGDRTRSFLKVQDGCNYFCAFCTIPLARGRSRSANVADTIMEARKAAQQGAREIVLTGVNIGDFGTSHNESLIDLVRALDGLDHVARYRISSIEPNLLDDELIEEVARSARFQPHFHLPLQSGSDDILAAMRRRYRTDLYRNRVEHIRRVMPHASIGVDVIVGFPGETQAKFEETLEFIKSLDVSYLHVFTYSERANTTALRIADVVPMHVRRERNKVLRNLSLKKQRQHYERQIGQVHDVLFEHAEEDGLRMGYTAHYVRVAARASEVEGNEICPVRLEKIHAGGWMSGTLMEPRTSRQTTIPGATAS